MKTSNPKAQAPVWHLVDATDQTLGRLASQIAHILRGKHRASFSPNQLCGDVVVVVNSEKLKMSQIKMKRTMYYSHSGYLGHLKTRTLEKMMQEKPSDVIHKAVKGMLASNRLRPLMLKRLHIFKGPEHRFAAQKPAPLAPASR
jgi:large subunit ribosomal protein L13